MRLDEAGINQLTPTWRIRVRAVASALQKLIEIRGAVGAANLDIQRYSPEFMETGAISRVGRYMVRFIYSVEHEGQSYRVRYSGGSWHFDSMPVAFVSREIAEAFGMTKLPNVVITEGK